MHNRSNHGSTIIELSAVAVLFSIMSVFCFDAAVMIYANSVIDEATRDAARCAALAKDQPTAQAAAQAALARHAINVPFLGSVKLSQPVEYVTTFTPPYDVIANPNGGPATVAATPYVLVQTSIAAKMPAPLHVYGYHLGGDNMTFNAISSFPLLRNEDIKPLGSFDKELPIWGPVTASNFYPCANPKACPPLATPCVLPPQPTPPPAAPPPPPPAPAPTPPPPPAMPQAPPG